MSTLVGHFVWSPKEREKRDRRGDKREGQGRKRNRNESEETEEIKTKASAQRVRNTPGQRHFLIIEYFEVNDNDIRQNQ